MEGWNTGILAYREMKKEAVFCRFDLYPSFHYSTLPGSSQFHSPLYFKEMNICIITSSFPASPSDVVQAPFLIDFIEDLKKRGHRVFVFTQDRGGEKQEFLEGVHINWFPWMGSDKPLVHLKPFHPRDGFRIMSLLWNGTRLLPSFLNKNRIDACLALWFLPGGYFANAAYRRTRIPYSVWALGSDIYRYGENPFFFPVMKRIAGEARGVFADGFDLAKRVEKRFKRKCFFLASAREIFLASPIEGEEGGFGKRGEGGSVEKPYRFLFVGRLESVKGIDLLLKAAALLKEEGPDFRLDVVGRGGMEEWARGYVREKELEGRIRLLGNVSDSGLAGLYTSADCIVIPSRSESIPLVFSEALRFGKELIVADVGDMGTLGREYGVARVVPPEDVQSLKQELKIGIESGRNGIERKNRKKRDELLRLFSVGASVERFLADYS
jgi:glycosyltransferase involved in cell wall biosynthesis